MKNKLELFGKYLAEPKRPFGFFLLLFAGSVLLRLLSFHYAVIDHDESTYMVIADRLLQGDQLYVDVVDNKPPGIFYLFAAWQALVGKSIIAFRFLAALMVALTAFFLYRAAQNLLNHESKAVGSAFSFLFLVSLYRYGLPANTELFFLPLTALGLYFFSLQDSPPRKQLGLSALAALSLGLAFSIKYVVIADVVALTFFFNFWREKKYPKINLGQIGRTVMQVGVFTLPLAGVVFYYWKSGELNSFWYYTIEAGADYSGQNKGEQWYKTLLDFHLKYLPFLLLFYFLWFRSKQENLKKLVALWYLMVWGIILYLQKGFDHYFLQLLLPISLLLGELHSAKRSIKDKFKKWYPKALVGAAVLLVLIIWGNQSYFWTREDQVRKLTKALKEEVKPTDEILCGQDCQLIPYLLDLKPISKIVHPTLLYNHFELYNIKAAVEVGKLLDKKPAYVIFREDKFFVTALRKRLHEEYELKDKFGKIKLYQRSKAEGH